jgi:hypothetical protein
MIEAEPVKAEEIVEDDAFYARVLKKETVKKQYRKERMIRETVMTEKDFLY